MNNFIKKEEINMNSQPNYILKLKSKDLIPKYDNLLARIIKISTIVIIAVIILGSIIFKENLFSELSTTAKALFISYVVYAAVVLFKLTKVPSPVSLVFFDDHLVVFKEKVYYSHKLYRQEFFKFYYSDISGLEYDYLTKRLNIYGNVEATWYNYHKDGTLSRTPDYHRFVDGTICYFYIFEGNETQIISYLENFCKKKFEFNNIDKKGVTKL